MTNRRARKSFARIAGDECRPGPNRQRQKSRPEEYARERAGIADAHEAVMPGPGEREDGTQGQGCCEQEEGRAVGTPGRIDDPAVRRREAGEGTESRENQEQAEPGCRRCRWEVEQ